MKKIYTFIYIILLSILSYNGYSQIPRDNSSAFEGKHFFVGFMENENFIVSPTNGIILEIYITSNLPGSVHLVCPGLMDRTYNLVPKKVLRVECPDQIENRTSEIPLQKAIELTSDVPIVVYSFSSQYTTSDAYTAIPVSNWGNEYVIISMPNDQYAIDSNEGGTDPRDYDPRSSEFMVMAAYDGTTITFQPKAVTLGGKQVYNTYTQVLNKGECYLVQSFLSPRGTADLSGTIVRSDKPIGVISGHVRTALPQNNWPDNDKNHLCEMLPPTNAWGKEFISVPFGTNIDGDWFKVAAIEPNTLVSYINPHGTYYISLTNAGDVVSVFDVPDATVWQSNKPIEIGQFMMHKFNSPDFRNFDPNFVILSSSDNFVSHILFQTCGNTPYNPNQFDAQYISLVADIKALPTLTLDGTLVKDASPNFTIQNISGTPYYWTRVQISDGTHELMCSEGSFSGVIYATGFADAYGMTLGSSLNNIYKNDSIPPTFAINDSCGKIYGTVTDNTDSTGSGVYELFVIQDSTLNYQYSIGSLPDSATSTTFSASPINVFWNGQIVIEARDRNGNGTRYRYYYQGIKLDVPAVADFQNVGYKDTSCIDIPIINYSQDTIRIDSLFLTKDKRIYFKKYPSFPIYLPGNDTLLLTLCAAPQGDTSLIKGLYFSLKFDCERYFSIPISGYVQAASLVAVGHDFGKRRVGDTTCADVKFINNGNVPITIDTLVYTQNPGEIYYDTLRLLPVTLQPGDSLIIPVCFVPDSVSNFTSILSANNDRFLPNSITVTGEGIAPLFESVTVDWGKRRVSTRNDTTIYLKNTGNCAGILSFLQFASSPTGFDTASIVGLNQLLQPNDSIPLSLSFMPALTQKYSTTADLHVDWRFHPPVNINLLGEGTLPEISTFDVVFDTTKIFKRRDTLATIIKSIGNEQLTIDSVYYFSGDSSSFIINLDLLKNKIMNPLAGDSTYISAISFVPKSLGQHEMLLEVLSDAAPAYQRVKSYIHISGFCIKEDTLEASLIMNKQILLPCNKGKVNIKITNAGNTNLVLQKLILDNGGLNVNWSPTPNLPVTFSPDSTLVFNLDVYLTAEDSGTVKIHAVFNDTLNKDIEFYLAPQKSYLTINKIADYDVTPGDTINIALTGDFPINADSLVDFSMKINTEEKNLYLVKENLNLILKNSSGQIFVPIEVSQNLTQILIKCRELLSISEKTEWSVNLRFLVLLSDVDSFTLNAIANSVPCSIGDSIAVGFKIINVCNLPLRKVRFFYNIPPPEIGISPVPANEKLNVSIKMPDDDNVNLKIYDIFGKKVAEYVNLYLKKGTYSLIFEIEQFADGIYFLSFSNSQMIKNIIFIKTK